MTGRCTFCFFVLLFHFSQTKAPTGELSEQSLRLVVKMGLAQAVDQPTPPVDNRLLAITSLQGGESIEQGFKRYP